MNNKISISDAEEQYKYNLVVRKERKANKKQQFSNGYEEERQRSDVHLLDHWTVNTKFYIPNFSNKEFSGQYYTDIQYWSQNWWRESLYTIDYTAIHHQHLLWHVSKIERWTWHWCVAATAETSAIPPSLSFHPRHYQPCDQLTMIQHLMPFIITLSNNEESGDPLSGSKRAAQSYTTELYHVTWIACDILCTFYVVTFNI